MELPQTTTVTSSVALQISAKPPTYQVGHVTNRATRRRVVKVNHNCPVLPGDDRLCDREWLTHPLKYVRSKQRWKQRMEEEAAPVAEANPPPADG